MSDLNSIDFRKTHSKFTTQNETTKPQPQKNQQNINESATKAIQNRHMRCLHQHIKKQRSNNPKHNTQTLNVCSQTHQQNMRTTRHTKSMITGEKKHR